MPRRAGPHHHKTEPAVDVCNYAHELLRGMSDEHNMWTGSFSAFFRENVQGDHGWGESSIRTYLQNTSSIRLEWRGNPRAKDPSKRVSRWWVNPSTVSLTAQDLLDAGSVLFSTRERRAKAKAAETRRERLYATPPTGTPLPDTTEGDPVTITNGADPTHHTQPLAIRDMPTVEYDIRDDIIPGKQVMVARADHHTQQEWSDLREQLLHERERADAAKVVVMQHEQRAKEALELVARQAHDLGRLQTEIARQRGMIQAIMDDPKMLDTMRIVYLLGKGAGG